MMNDVEFWNNWSRRLEENKDSFIKPNNKDVIDLSRKVSLSNNDMAIDRAYKVWDVVRSNIDYEISVTWKTPSRTIKVGEGDCKDMTFLISSMLPNVGVMSSDICLGILNFPDGISEEHVWNEVDGQVIDATGDQEDIETLNYEKSKTIELSFNREKIKRLQ